MVSGSGPDEDDVGGGAGFGKLGTLGQESVAGMNGVGRGFEGDADDVGDVEIGLDRPLALAHQIAFVSLGPVQREAIFLRVDGDGADAELGGGAHDSNGDFAAVGDEKTFYAPRLRQWIHRRMMIALPRVSGHRNRSTMFGLAIHGGAGTLPRAETSGERERKYREGLGEALDAGFAVLQAGGTSLDAVTRAVVLLEDNPLFNAGRGSVFTLDGRNELDAAIMDGATLKAGAVCGLAHIKNPVELARTVMEHSEYVMLSGAGAEEFALEPRLHAGTPQLFPHPGAMAAARTHSRAGTAAVGADHFPRGHRGSRCARRRRPAGRCDFHRRHDRKAI